MSSEPSTNELNPLLGIDVPRLEKEMERYQQLLDEHADHAYRIAEEARKLESRTKKKEEAPAAREEKGQKVLSYASCERST